MLAVSTDLPSLLDETQCLSACGLRSGDANGSCRSACGDRCTPLPGCASLSANGVVLLVQRASQWAGTPSWCASAGCTPCVVGHCCAELGGEPGLIGDIMHPMPDPCHCDCTTAKGVQEEAVHCCGGPDSVSLCPAFCSDDSSLAGSARLSARTCAPRLMLSDVERSRVDVQDVGVAGSHLTCAQLPTATGPPDAGEQSTPCSCSCASDAVLDVTERLL